MQLTAIKQLFSSHKEIIIQWNRSSAQFPTHHYNLHDTSFYVREAYKGKPTK